MRVVRDPFDVIGKIPKGRVYQWATESVLGDKEVAESTLLVLKEAGWKPVPSSRHPRMKRVGRRIVVLGQVLVENSAKRATAARQGEINASRWMVASDPAGKFVGRPFRSADTAWTAQEPVWGPVPATDGLPRIVDTVVQLKLGHKLVEAAAVCALSVEEYARRLVLLVLRGDLDGVLAPTLERDAFEFRDFALKERKQ